MFHRLFVFAFVAVAVLAAAPLLAQPDESSGPVVVADVRGPLDQRTIDYLRDAVETPGAHLVILQIDAPGIASGDPEPLYQSIRETDTPTAVWVGPDGAEAYGGAGRLVLEVDVAGAAPGASIGLFDPLVAGGEPTGCNLEASVCAAFDTAFEITEDGPNPGFIDEVVPTIGQFIAAFDGLEVRGTVLETVMPLEGDVDDVIVPSVVVRFTKPGLFTRFLRLSIRPEATFFFLVVGLVLVAFEFYAAGAGVAAAVGVLSLFLAGYGLATLPINWAAVLAVVLGVLMYSWEFQRNSLGIRSLVGTALLVAGGLSITTGAPQFAPRWWAVLLIVVGAALFYVFGIATVVRSRFSTPTIGREHLVGKRGVAETDFDPEGVVTLDGARWRARSHRAAGLGPGDPVEVLEVKGIVLEVGPPTT
jgi:membrane-bound serine protease (ClpP class)